MIIIEKTRRMRYIWLILLLLIILANNALATEIIKTYGTCKPGLHLPQNGPFATIVFCEYALGSHIGVIYYKKMEAPAEGQWKITDRFWQEQNWGADVTSFAWDSKGMNLFISTSIIYGTGDIYRLDLKNKKAIRIFPKGKYAKQMGTAKGYCLTTIDSIDELNRKIAISINNCEDKNDVKLKIDY